MIGRKNKVAKRESNLPASVDLFEEDANSGFEDADREAFAIPYLQIIQKSSPQVDEDNPEFIPEAKPGMIYNTATSEIYPEDVGVLVVPVHYSRVFNEWKPYDLGGGFRGVHQVDDQIVDKAKNNRDESGRFVLENGNLLKDTRNHFCLRIREDGSFEPVLITFSSTQIKKSRNWMTKMTNIKVEGKNGPFTPASFSQIYRLRGTRPESNDKGSWKGWIIEHERAINPENKNDLILYKEARTFRQAIVSGKIEVTPPPSEDFSEVSEDKF